MDNFTVLTDFDIKLPVNDLYPVKLNIDCQTITLASSNLTLILPALWQN